MAVFRKFESFASSESGRLLLVGPAGVGLVKTLESSGYYRGSGNHGAYGLVLTQGSVRIVAGMGDFEEIARIPTESIKACRPAMVTTRTRRMGGIELDLEGPSGSAKIALGATGTGPFHLWAQKLRDLKAIAATLESAAVRPETRYADD